MNKVPALVYTTWWIMKNNQGSLGVEGFYRGADCNLTVLPSS